MRKAVVVLALAPILAVAWGCKGTPAWKGSIETADGVQVVRNPKVPMYPQGALVLQEELTIGVAEGAEEYTFVRLRGIAVDDQGAIFALDQRKPPSRCFRRRRKPSFARLEGGVRGRGNSRLRSSSPSPQAGR